MGGKMKEFAEICPWNWENKLLLLQAEQAYTIGEYNNADTLYASAIRSANQHMFVHEEALASELAGIFCYEQGVYPKACSFLCHAVECYKKWGAQAVANRVESFLQDKFSSLSAEEDYIEGIIQSKDGQQKKRSLL